MSVHISMLELGVDFNLHKVDLSKGEQRAPEYLKINPRGQVGALMTPDGLLTENAAMIIYLSDKHGGNLIPQEGFERAKALQWLMYANSTLHPAYSKVLFSMKNGASEDVIQKACDGVQAQWDLVEKQLTESGGPYLAGTHCGPGDIYTAVIANWQFIPRLPKFGPKTKAFLQSVTARPAYQKAIAVEGVEYKAAA
jgi:glutathione S-transferase